MPLFTLTKAAEKDVMLMIKNGIALFGKKQAFSYHQGLKNTFLLLNDNPQLGTKRTEFRQSVRSYIYNSHIILYAVHENNDLVVLRVRHHREDWTKDD